MLQVYILSPQHFNHLNVNAVTATFSVKVLTSLVLLILGINSNSRQGVHRPTSAIIAREPTMADAGRWTFYLLGTQQHILLLFIFVVNAITVPQTLASSFVCVFENLLRSHLLLFIMSGS